MTWELRQDGAPAGSGELHSWHGAERACAELRLDAGETNILAQQLEEVEAEVLRADYPDVKTAQILPIDTSGDPGAETVSFSDSDGNAKWQLMGEDGAVNDAPSSSMKRTKDAIHYHSFFHAFGWSVNDVRRAQRANVPLATEQALLARESWEEMFEGIVATGYTGTDLRGFLNYSGIDLDTEAGAWEDETSGSDLVELFMGVFNTKMEEIEGIDSLMPNRYLLPLSIFNHLNTVPFVLGGIDTGKTALDMCLERARKIVPDFQINWWRKCRLAGAGGTVHRSVLYRADPRVVKAKVSVPFEMLPVQPENLRFKVPCHARTAGVMIRKPLGVKYIDIPVETP
jgi:hypothetical protein